MHVKMSAVMIVVDANPFSIFDIATCQLKDKKRIGNVTSKDLSILSNLPSPTCLVPFAKLRLIGVPYKLNYHSAVA
jgi:hypothetical protein